MITAVVGSEAGVGKVTIATNLAVMRAACGRDLLLIDATKDGGASDFTNSREDRGRHYPGYTCVHASTLHSLTMAIERLAPKFEEVIIVAETADTRFAAMTACDICLFPTRPLSGLPDEDKDLLDCVLETKPSVRACVIVNFAWHNYAQVDRDEEDGVIVPEFFEFEFLPGALTGCAAYVRARKHGRAITELEGEDHNPAAVQELTMLFEELYGAYEPQPKQTRRIATPSFCYELTDPF